MSKQGRFVVLGLGCLAVVLSALWGRLGSGRSSSWKTFVSVEQGTDDDAVEPTAGDDLRTERAVSDRADRQAAPLGLPMAGGGATEAIEEAPEPNPDPRANGFVVTEDGTIVLDGDRLPPGAAVAGPPSMAAANRVP